MAITPKLMTWQELAQLPDDGMRHELVRGVLHTMPLIMWPEATVISDITHSLRSHLQANGEDPRPGKVWNGVGFQLTTDPDTVRAANVVFMRRDRVPPRGWEGYVPGAPDLAVEVVSPTDLYLYMVDKIEDWLAHGTRLVIVVNARRPSVVVYRPHQRPQPLGLDDVLDGEDVVPGWTLPVRDLFDEA
jgi:Uma2 family endonuclease